MFGNSTHKYMAQSFPNGTVLSLMVVGLDGSKLPQNAGVSDRLKGTSLVEIDVNFGPRDDVFRIDGPYLRKEDVRAVLPISRYAGPIDIARVEVVNLCTGVCALYYPKRVLPSKKSGIKLSIVSVLVPNVLNEDGLLPPKTVVEWSKDPRSSVYEYLEVDRYGEEEEVPKGAKKNKKNKKNKKKVLVA